MATGTIDFGWMLILPIFGVLFMVIWNSLKSSSIFPKPTCLVITFCVSVLCILGAMDFFTQDVVVLQKEVSLQEPQASKFYPILLPYLTLMISLLLLFVALKIVILINNTYHFFRPSRHEKKEKVAEICQNELKQIN